MSSYDNSEIDPNVLADVTRVVQELMKMQRQQRLEEQEIKKYNSAHNLSHQHKSLDGATSVSHGDFDDQEHLEHADSQDVEIEMLSVQEKQNKEQKESDQSESCGWADQTSLLPSSSSTSSLVLSSSSSSLSESASSSSYITTPSIPESTLLPPVQLDKHKSSPTYLAAPALSKSTLPSKTDNINNNEDCNAHSNGPTAQTQISLLPGQKTPTRATTNMKGSTNTPDAPDHKYFDHDNNTTSQDSTCPLVKESLKPGALGSVPLNETPTSTLVVPRTMPLPPTRPRRKKALLIGINYFGDPNQLLGCINDTRDVFGFLNGYYGFRYQDTIMLTDDQIYEDKRPTAANIRYWMKWLVKDAEPQDSLFFHYAGHGGRIKDFSYNGKAEHLGDETDGYDEIIYPCDYLRTGIISDDEMYDLLVKDLPAGVQLTALVDACHSGTMLDLPYVYNGNHVTALEKVTRTKVGAMAAMSAPMDVVFDLPGSNNTTQTQTQTTTTTTTTTTVTMSLSNNGSSNHVVAQYSNGTVSTTDGYLSPPGGVPTIHAKESGSPLIGSSQTYSKRSILSEDDSRQSDDSVMASSDHAMQDTNSSISEQNLMNDNLYPTFQISEPVVSAPHEQTVASLWSATATSESCSLLSVPSEDNDLQPSPRKRSKSVHNMGVLGGSEMDQRGIEIDSQGLLRPIDEAETPENNVVAIKETDACAPQKAMAEAVEDEEEGMAEARKMALFRETKGNVVMFSGCRDDQASADIRASAKDAAIIADHHRQQQANSVTNWSSPSSHDQPDYGQLNPLGYSLPQPYTSPMARGAVSYAWIQCLSQKREQTYEELLTSMRHFMKQRDLDQIPQLGSVWSSIDTDNDNSASIPSSFDNKEEPSDSVIFRQHHHHQHQLNQSELNHDPQQTQQTQSSSIDTDFDGSGRPFLLPEAELRPMIKDLSDIQVDKSSLDNSSDPVTTPSPLDIPSKSQKQLEKERLKKEKAEAKRLRAEWKRLREERKKSREEHRKYREEQRKSREEHIKYREEQIKYREEQKKKLEEHRKYREEHRKYREEQRRIKEERRRKKAEKLLKLQQLDQEPYPALISTSNARVAALNLRAFAKFCHSKEAQERFSAAINAADVRPEMDFTYYEEWLEYIYNKNTGLEQEEMTTPISIAANTGAQDIDSSDLLLSLSDEQEHDASISANPPSRKQRLQQRPLFMERPLRGWIINYTSILEPCNRTIHTSAHCLDYLTKEHLYLVPSREARSLPNRPFRRPYQIEKSEDGDTGTNTESDTDKVAIDEFQQETGSGSDGRAVTTTITKTTIIVDKEEIDEEPEAEMMNFHIFWQGVITDKLSLSAHSFLFSQPLDRARLHLWIDSSNLPGGVAEDYLQNPYAKDLVTEPLNRYIKLHVWDQEAQREFAYPPPPLPLENDDSDQLLDEEESEHMDNLSYNTPITPPVALSDEARFLILNRYGGMYLDADVLLLRDMSPFYDSGMEFAYEWSNTQMYNTAILRLNKGSSVARRILDGAIAREKEIQEKKLLKEMRNSNTKVKATKDGSASTNPLQLKNISVDNNLQDKKRLRGGKPRYGVKIDTHIAAPTLVSSTLSTPATVAVDASLVNDLTTHDSDDDDTLGTSDGDSLFDVPMNRFSKAYHRHHHHRRQLNKREEMRPDEIYHPARLRGYLRPQDNALENNGLVMMPVAVFDPLWLRIDSAESKIGMKTDQESTVEDLHTFPDAFSSSSNSVCPQQDLQLEEGEERVDFTAGPEVFMMGAYAYHWHNNWLTPIGEQSWMGLMKDAYDQFLVGERPNLYGEWFYE
ncbi:Ca(2+)-dependent cysteine protease [Linnemannia zychae]|nr:Ca(2+)-dependent cysteine protease [Linnemannia zychae]